MRRCGVLFLCLLTLAAGCATAGPRTAAGSTTTLTYWASWSGDDLTGVQKLVRGFEEQHPGIKVNLVGDQGDTAKLVSAINAGNGPDLVSNTGAAQLGKLCTSGAYSDLAPRLAKDGIQVSVFPPVAQAATAFNGRRCALPFIADTYGLYYNKSLLAKAGFTGPPRTVSELSAMAKKLTELNPDGSIKTAGFVPLFDFYENYTLNVSPAFGAPYFDAAGKASLTDPAWTDLLTWQKSLVDFYGYDKLSKFAAGAGEEFSSSNGFETGKIAMVLDGEWRTGILAKEHPELDYATAPFPVADNRPDLYGSSEVSVGVLAIPRGARHGDAAWELAKTLAVDTSHVVALAAALHNVPTTVAGLTSPDLHADPNFGPFLQSFGNPKSSFPTLLAQGPVYFDPITNFVERWQSGQVADLGSELNKVDTQIDALVAQG